MRAVGGILALAALALFLTPPARKLVAGHRYRATFDAPEPLRAWVGRPELVGLFPKGAAVSLTPRGQIVAEFVAVQTADLDDPSTPQKGDLTTPFGPMILRRLERLD